MLCAKNVYIVLVCIIMPRCIYVHARYEYRIFSLYTMIGGGGHVTGYCVRYVVVKMCIRKRKEALFFRFFFFSYTFDGTARYRYVTCTIFLTLGLRSWSIRLFSRVKRRKKVVCGERKKKKMAENMVFLSVKVCRRTLAFDKNMNMESNIGLWRGRVCVRWLTV